MNANSKAKLEQIAQRRIPRAVVVHCPPQLSPRDSMLEEGLLDLLNIGERVVVYHTSSGLLPCWRGEEGVEFGGAI